MFTRVWSNMGNAFKCLEVPWDMFALKHDDNLSILNS